MKKLIFSSKYFMFLFMLTSLVYVGCNKEEGKELASVSSSSTQLRTTVTPTVENGTLKFNNLEDVFAYMEELSTQIKQLSELGDETSDLVHPAVTISDQMASTLGFSSIYKLNPKDSDGSLINPIFPIDAMNMILNNHYEVIVGNEIYVHKNVTQHFKIQANDAANRAILRNIPPGSEIELVDLKPGIQIFNDGPKEIQAMTKDCDCGLSLELTTGVPLPSIDYNAFVLKHGCIGLNSGQTWTVNWTEIGGSASGTLSGTYNAAANNPNAIFLVVPKSVKEIKVELCIFLSCNGQPLKQYCFDISKSISDNCCKKFQTIDADPVVFQSQGFKLVTQYKNGIAWEMYYHTGKTSIRRLSDNDKLKSKKLEIWANAKNRTAPNNVAPGPGGCVVFETDNDYDSCNNCKDLDISVWANKSLTHHKNGDVTFNYRGSRHSSFGATQITPTYCN